MADTQDRSGRKKAYETRSYHRTQMQKEHILEKLKERGCRITKQRKLLLDIILENDCSCCKEIYYKAAKVDNSIGTATVYRMVNMLEEIGAIDRRNMYKVAYPEHCALEDACTVALTDETVYHLSAREWNAVVKAGLLSLGYVIRQDIKSILVKGCECSSVGQEGAAACTRMY